MPGLLFCAFCVAAALFGALAGSTNAQLLAHHGRVLSVDSADFAVNDLLEETFYPVPTLQISNLVELRAAAGFRLAQPGNDTGDVEDRQPNGCPFDVYCPFPNGRCCASGKLCCPVECIDQVPPRCGVTALENALLVARKKLAEEGHKQITQHQLKGLDLKSEQTYKQGEEHRKQMNEEAAKDHAEADEDEKKGRMKVEEQTDKKELFHSEAQQKYGESSVKRTLGQITEADEEERKAGEQTEKRVHFEESQAKRDRQQAEQIQKQEGIRIITTHNFNPRLGNVIIKRGQLKPSLKVTWMFWIRIDKADENWTCFMHRGTTSKDHRPSFFIYPSSTKVYVISATRDDPEAHIVTDVKQLVLGKWHHIAFRHRDRWMSLLLDGEEVAYNFTVGPPIEDVGDLTAVKDFPKVSGVTLADVRYAPYFVTNKDIRRIVRQQKYFEDGKVSVVVQDKNWEPRRMHQLASAEKTPTSRAYSLSFWLYIKDTAPGYTSILQKGDRKWDRSPGIFMVPNKPALHFRSSTANHRNEGLTPPDHIPMGQWTHITVAHREKKIAMFINGKRVAMKKHVEAPILNAGHWWSADPWHNPAPVIVADVRFYTAFVDREDILDNMKQKNYQAVEPNYLKIRSKAFSPQPGSVVAVSNSIRYTGAYTFLFWIRPLKLVENRTNIIFHGIEPSNPGPGIFFLPNSTALRVEFPTNLTQSDSVGARASLRMYYWSHVAVVHGGGQLVVYINGQETHRVAKNPILKVVGPLFASAPWFTPAAVRLADLRFVGQALPHVFVTRVYKLALHPTDDDGEKP